MVLVCKPKGACACGAVAGGVPTQVTPSPLELELEDYDDGELNAERRLVIAPATSVRRWHLHPQGEPFLPFPWWSTL
jgi:hypothetical protein